LDWIEGRWSGCLLIFILCRDLSEREKREKEVK